MTLQSLRVVGPAPMALCSDSVQIVQNVKNVTGDWGIANGEWREWKTAMLNGSLSPRSVYEN